LAELVAAKTRYEAARANGESTAEVAISYAMALRERPAEHRNLHAARLLLEEAAAQEDAAVRARLALGIVAEERGALEEAQAHVASVLEQDEVNAEAHYRLAFLYRTRMAGPGFPDPAQALEPPLLPVEHA